MNQGQGSLAVSGHQGQDSVARERGLAVVEWVVGRSRDMLAKPIDLVFVGEGELGSQLSWRTQWKGLEKNELVLGRRGEKGKWRRGGMF
jgi:hypothetical protein